MTIHNYPQIVLICLVLINLCFAASTGLNAKLFKKNGFKEIKKVSLYVLCNILISVGIFILFALKLDQFYLDILSFKPEAIVLSQLFKFFLPSIILGFLTGIILKKSIFKEDYTNSLKLTLTEWGLTSLVLSSFLTFAYLIFLFPEEVIGSLIFTLAYIVTVFVLPYLNLQYFSRKLKFNSKFEDRISYVSTFALLIQIWLSTSSLLKWEPAIVLISLIPLHILASWKYLNLKGKLLKVNVALIGTLFLESVLLAIALLSSGLTGFLLFD